MGHNAKIIKDSISSAGVRLTTMEVTFPRIVLAEFNTHRAFSRNSASSRAIPIEKMIKRVKDDPYVPTHWGKNQKGMQADVEVDEATAYKARNAWLKAMAWALEQARILMELGIHKQVTNRLLEPFMWHTAIVSATEWDNFFHLRCNPDAHPEIRQAADLMLEAMRSSKPTIVEAGEWHLPLLDEPELKELSDVNCPYAATKVSVGRCARVSYLTHDGKRDFSEDVALHDRLLKSGHMSPFEHVAIATRSASEVHGNFRGWVQYRKLIPHENDILSPLNAGAAVL